MQEDYYKITQMRFPRKLWHLLHMRIEAIFWGGTGKTILLNYQLLQNYLLRDHCLFNTNNISSFVRQLNLYGFRKVTSHLQDPLCNSNNPHIHEYIHDCFQSGKPELLDKIKRKVSIVKKTIIAKHLYLKLPIFRPISSLQKARRALRVALKKAAQDLSRENSNKFTNYYFQCKDSQEAINANGIFKTNIKHEEPLQYGFTKYNDESSKQDNENLQTQFLHMPDDPETHIELLAEFDVDNEVDEGIIKKSISNNNNEHSMNCVLPSVSNEEIDDDTMLKKKMDNQSHLQKEWDLMFNDDSRDNSFYTQISPRTYLNTFDFLNGQNSQ